MVVASGAVIVSAVVEADSAGSVEFPIIITGSFAYAMGKSKLWSVVVSFS